MHVEDDGGVPGQYRVAGFTDVHGKGHCLYIGVQSHPGDGCTARNEVAAVDDQFLTFSGSCKVVCVLERRGDLVRSFLGGHECLAPNHIVAHASLDLFQWRHVWILDASDGQKGRARLGFDGAGDFTFLELKCLRADLWRKTQTENRLTGSRETTFLWLKTTPTGCRIEFGRLGDLSRHGLSQS